MTKPVFLSIRDAKGRCYSVNPFDIKAELPQEVQDQARALIAALSLQPKRPRGRPTGYRCSEATVNAMVAGRAKTLAQKRQGC